MKVFLEMEQIEKYIELHRKMKIPFEMTLTNYTTRIKSDYKDIHFLRSAQSKQMFCAYAMLKKDVVNSPVPDVDQNALVYHSIGFNQSQKHPTVYNIDLKSAYATCLLNNGLIRKKTFDYLSKLPKLDRLAAVGMLAGRKTIFLMDENGNPVSEETKISELENYFFFCVKEVGELMGFAASYMGASYLFTWVDGIYFLPGGQDGEESARGFYKIFRDWFLERGYKVTFEVLNDFSVTSFRDTWKVSFKKDGDPKNFNIPKKELDLKRRVSNYLLTKKY